jgi:O-antigen/teichoic acid export membrane protein
VSRKAQTLGGNASVVLAAQLSIFAVGLVISVFVAHALGPSGRGRYYVPVTAVMTCFAVVHLSLEMATTYFHAERLIDLRRLGRVAATVSLIVSPVGIGLILGTFALTRSSIFDGVHANDVVLASLALPFLLHSTWMVNLMILGGQLGRAQLALLVAAVCQAVLIGMLALAGHLGVREVLLAYVGNAVASWVLLVAWSARIAPALPTRDGAVLTRVVLHGLRIHPGYIAYILLLRSDVFLINALLGTSEVGLYSLAVLVAQLVWTVSQPLATAALPLQTTADIAEAGRVTLRTTRLCLLVAASLSVLAAATMWKLLPIVYGRDFAGAYLPLVALLPGVCAMSVVRPMWNRLLREGRPGRITAVAAASFALNAALNLALLPVVGLVGASIASSVSYLLLALVLGCWTAQAVGTSPRALLPGRVEITDIAACVRTLRGALPRAIGRAG